MGARSGDPGGGARPASRGLRQRQLRSPSRGAGRGGAGLEALRLASARLAAEDRARARRLVVEGLEALAAGSQRLLDEEPEGMEDVRRALDRVREARALLVAGAVRAESESEGPPRLTPAVETVAIPLDAIDPAAVESLRPFRFAWAQSLRVDLGELERRLTRAVSRSPERALGELFLATAVALELAPGPPPSLAGDSAAPPAPGAAGGAGS